MISRLREQSRSRRNAKRDLRGINTRAVKISYLKSHDFQAEKIGVPSQMKQFAAGGIPVYLHSTAVYTGRIKKRGPPVKRHSSIVYTCSSRISVITSPMHLHHNFCYRCRNSSRRMPFCRVRLREVSSSVWRRNCRSTYSLHCVVGRVAASYLFCTDN